MDCKWFAVCPMKKFYEKGKLDKKWIELYCKGDWESCVRYQMEGRGEESYIRIGCCLMEALTKD